jgi:hypothetical protein
MFSSDGSAAVGTTSDPGTSANANATTTSKRKLFGKRTSLPPGTGPGTSGHPAEVPMQNDLERSKAGQRTSGYGSDAMGGTPAGTGIDRTAARDSRARAMNGDQVTTNGPASYPKVGALGSETEGKRR